MSTNPNNAVGTNAAYSGRTSVNAFNDDLAAYGRGILSGWACSPSTGLKVQLGGSGITRDVAVAVDNAGNRTTINNISGAPIEMTISAAPSTNSRIDAIVAYVDNPAEGVSTVADNPAACGMIVVKGTAAASPVEPNESTIRAAITADGASGVTAYYAILATVTIASGTTDLTSGNIAAGPSAGIGAQNIDFATFSTTAEIPCGTWVDGSVIYKKTLLISSLPNTGQGTYYHNIPNINLVINIEGFYTNDEGTFFPANTVRPDDTIGIGTFVDPLNTLIISVGTKDRTNYHGYVTLYYTKTNS